MHGRAITKTSSHMKDLKQTKAVVLLFHMPLEKVIIFRTPLEIALLTASFNAT
jgi:hypothetical protein